MIFFGFGCGCRLNERDRRLLQGSPLRLSGLSGSSVGEELRFGLRLSGGLRVNWIPRPARFAKGKFSFGRAAPRRSSNKFGSALGLHYLCRGIEKMRSC